MFFTFLIVVILTAIALVVVAMTIECKVGYYLFAILFLMFDIETVFLFPWAVVVNEVGTYALVCVAFFLLVLILGLAYAWRKGALEWK